MRSGPYKIDGNKRGQYINVPARLSSKLLFHQRNDVTAENIAYGEGVLAKSEMALSRMH